MWIGILVLAWFIVQYARGSWDQAKTEARRAAANWSQTLQGRMNDGWNKGPIEGGRWFWAALGHRLWRGAAGGRNGGGRTQLPASTPWRRVAGAGWARGRIHAGQARRRLQASSAAGTFTPAAAFAELLAIFAVLAAAATLVTPHRRPRQGRRARGTERQRRGGFETGFCDGCHRMFAANALRMKHCELHGSEGWWMLCPVCRGDSAVPEPPAGDLPPAAAESEAPAGDAGLDELLAELDEELEVRGQEAPPAAEAPAEPAVAPLPAGWSRRADGLPETPADTRFFDLRDVLGWQGLIDWDNNPVGAAPEDAEVIEARLQDLASQPRPYLLTVTRLDGSPVTPGSPGPEITLPVWSAEDLDRRLDQIGEDPALEASVAIPAAARPQASGTPGQPEPAAEPTEGEPGDMANGTVAVSGGDAFTHGQWNTAVADIYERLGLVPGQTDEMTAGLNSAEAGRDQVHGVIALGANIATFQEMVMAMFATVNGKEMGIVEGYAAAGGVDKAPVPAYLAET